MALRDRVDQELENIEDAIRVLLENTGSGKMEAGAYDTAWVGRLATRYPGWGFDGSLEWLRQHQYDDGTWGAPLWQYHDRYISTLAAIVSLRENGTHPKDERRVRRGEDALWKIVGSLSKDDSDTVGFPLLASGLTTEANSLRLDVPQPPIRYAEAYRHKLSKLMKMPIDFWHTTALTASFEGMLIQIAPEDILSENGSVGMSPAATAAVLFHENSPPALNYLRGVLDVEKTGGAPNFSPIDTFEINWVLNSLRTAGAIRPDHPRVAELIEYLWKHWSTKDGLGYSRFLKFGDVDDAIAAMMLFRWAGYPITADVLAFYEKDDHFCCYLDETDPSPSANARVLSMLKFFPEHPSTPEWSKKVVSALRRFDETGIYWWDKWHSSPYYATSVAIDAMYDVALDMVTPRIRWILRTQRDDGGWGHLGSSTAEETAYCLTALTLWNKKVERVAPHVMQRAAQFILRRLNDPTPPLWIAKSLYTPTYMVRAAILGALYGYYTS